MSASRDEISGGLFGAISAAPAPAAVASASSEKRSAGVASKHRTPTNERCEPAAPIAAATAATELGYGGRALAAWPWRRRVDRLRCLAELCRDVNPEMAASFERDAIWIERQHAGG